MKNHRMFLLIVLMALGAVNVSYAGRVKLPGRDVLTKRLSDGIFRHFVQKTDLIDQLADEEMDVEGLIIEVELSLYDYSERFKASGAKRLLQMIKPKLIEAILEGNSEAIQEAQDIYKKIEKEDKSEK